jgi:hypothetical protein
MRSIAKKTRAPWLRMEAASDAFWQGTRSIQPVPNQPVAMRSSHGMLRIPEETVLHRVLGHTRCVRSTAQATALFFMSKQDRIV